MIETLKRFVLKRIELLKIEAIEKASLSASKVTYIIILLVAFAFFIILFNFGIAFLIGKELNNYSYGFLIVAAFYLLLIIFTIILKKRIINSIANKIIKSFNQ
ncbi:phage holin family protein [Chryseobacterium indologenes]|uniref:phage holin family protein n=1 Tax=Chryseobacterium indologenes TaxID=253 RepID=UPI0010243A2B|nr:phage holin family protein [Chryseobacterium indologenes]VFA44098.1 Protein of uncharacterised function (DUF1469) [Chryseobacterium indologenes]